MRKAIAGVNDSGKSIFAVITESDIFGDQDFRAPIWRTTSTPPAVDFEIPRSVPARNLLEVPATGTTWDLIRLRPGFDGDYHRTDTLDYNMLIQGAVTLRMEEGDAFEMVPGDCVVMPALLHRWTSVSGCILAVVCIDMPG